MTQSLPYQTDFISVGEDEEEEIDILSSSAISTQRKQPGTGFIYTKGIQE